MGASQEQQSSGQRSKLRLAARFTRTYVGRHKRSTAIIVVALAVTTAASVSLAANGGASHASVQSKSQPAATADTIPAVEQAEQANERTNMTPHFDNESAVNGSQTSVTVNGQAIPVPENGTYSTTTSPATDTGHTQVTVHSTHSSSTTASGGNGTSSQSSSVNINISNKNNSNSSSD
jgi:hypothetical protein